MIPVDSPRQTRTVPAAKVSFSPSDRQWIAQRIEEVLATGQLTLGKYGAEFESKFAGFCGSGHAVAVSSGTSALEIILRALDVAGKDVLVPTNTFFATAAAVVHAGGNPVLIDMDAGSFGIRPEDVEGSLTANTAGVVAVHIGGMVSPRMAELRQFCDSRGLWLVEDAAHAHGSSYLGRKAGTFGVAAAFSFYPTKVMTSAEGGMITTDDPRVAEEARIYRDQGKKSFSENSHVRMGHNWRMSEPHAIIGLRHLERLPEMIADRQRMAAVYDRELTELRHVAAVRVPEGSVSNYYKYLALLDTPRDRKELKATLRGQFGVSLAGEVYDQPLHLQPVFARYAVRPLPVAEEYCGRHICLPVYSGMERADVLSVVRALSQVVG